MSQSCTSSPTLTQTSQIVTQSLDITSTDSVTTSPPTTTTVVIESCVPTLPPGSCVTTDVTLTSTIPGATSTVQVPLTLTVDVTSDVLNTLYGTSCTVISTSRPDTTTTTTIPPPTTTQYSTPAPTVITSKSTSTQADGSVIVQTMTTVATQSPVPVPTTVQNSDTADIRTQIAPIVGGVVGGFFGLIAIVALIWCILKRRRRWDDMFEKEGHDVAAAIGPGRNHYSDRFSLDVDVGPKPYQYGLVGHTVPPGAASPPNSPPLLPVLHTSADSYGPQSRHERHRSSLTPLNLPMTASTPAPSATTSSRPSTGGSTQPLRPASHQGSAHYQQSQQRPGRTTSAPGPSHSHQMSGTSFTAFSTRSSSADRGIGYPADPSAIGMTVFGGADGTSYPNRSGSPGSVLDEPARRLTVANATSNPNSPDSVTFSPHASSAAAVSAVAVTTAVPQRDGKGRLRSLPPKAPIVHLDGGRVQQRILDSHHRTDGPPSSAGPLPPAYEA